MPKAEIRECDKGTRFAAALQRQATQGASHCDDAAAMAGLLESAAQIMLGGVSPRLLWEGAQHLGLTALEMNALMVKNPQLASELMWVETDKPAPASVARQVKAAVKKAQGR